MTKQNFITKVTEKIEGMTKKDAALIIDTIGEVITEALVAGDDITIPGVGKFSVKEVPERTGTIMMGERKGEKYVTPAHNAPKFKAATTLKNAVKEEI